MRGVADPSLRLLWRLVAGQLCILHGRNAGPGLTRTTPAKQRDRNLLCCFCGCSAFNAVFVIYMLIGYFTFAGTEAHQDSYGVSALTVILLICSAVLYVRTVSRGCYVWLA